MLQSVRGPRLGGFYLVEPPRNPAFTRRIVAGTQLTVTRRAAVRQPNLAGNGVESNDSRAGGLESRTDVGGQKLF